MTTEPLPRPDWRDSLALAADLALLGIVVTIASVPVVTAGGALATASVAVDRACRDRGLPPTAELLRTFLRALLPGLGAMAVAAAAVGLLVADLAVLWSGQVPGGPALLVVTALVGLYALAVALLAVVRVGGTDGRGWRAAVGWSARLIAARPLAGVAVLLVVALPVLLASAIAVTAPLLVGFGLFALHVVVRRTAR